MKKLKIALALINIRLMILFFTIAVFFSPELSVLTIIKMIDEMKKQIVLDEIQHTEHPSE